MSDKKPKRKHIDKSMLPLIIAMVFTFTICAVAIIGAASNGIAKVMNRREIVVVVQDKWTKRYFNTEKYLIGCKDINNEQEEYVFEITDSLLAFRWDSSDLYGKIEPGHVYRMEICGYRVPILSRYPNIYVADEIKDYSIYLEETETENGVLVE